MAQLKRSIGAGLSGVGPLCPLFFLYLLKNEKNYIYTNKKSGWVFGPSKNCLLYLTYFDPYKGSAKNTTPFMREEGKDSTFYFYTPSSPLLKRGKNMGKKENEFQAKLIKDIKKMFDGCIITKLDSGHIQGIPDLLILYKNKWACLECKRSKNAPHRPNQEYYVELMDKMSFSRFIFPENKEEVLHELQQAFKS